MKELTKLMQARFDKMCATGKLFRSNVSGQQVWDTYLKSFSKENDPVFRDTESSSHNCNNCKNFIRRYGNIVSINENGELESIFTIAGLNTPEEYQNSIFMCNDLLINSKVENVFFETYDELNSLPYEKCSKTNTVFRLGIAQNFKQYTTEEVAKFGVVNTEKVYEFNHFHLDIPTAFVDKSGKSIGQIEGIYRDKYSVFKRTMEEVSLSTYQMCIDLINEGALVNSDKYVSALEQYIIFKQNYGNSSNKENYCWNTTYSLDESFAKFGNSNIGANFLKAVEKGEKELDEICTSFNKLEDPSNKFKANSAVTNAMKIAAMKTIEELGITEQFNRRHTTLDDIKANTVGYINRDATKAKINLFAMDENSDNSIYQKKQFDNVDAITIEELLSNIENYSSVELLLENDMSLFNMTSPTDPNLSSIFKYGNNHSFTVNGDLAGESTIKQQVALAGGKTDAAIRFSLLWNDKDTPGILDFDLHCLESKGDEIFYLHKRSYKTDGWLDVDMIRPNGIGIENITHEKIPNMDLVYFIRNYDGGSNQGFKAELVINGETHSYHYNKPVVGSNTDIKVVTIKANGEIIHHLPSNTSSTKLWNLDTLKFHKVSCICPSPNYWNIQSGTLHHLFAIKGCHNDKAIKTFHIDNLIPELLKDRKALQVLAEIKKVEPVGNQFAGVCFNATYRRSIILRVVKGGKKQVIKVTI
jgi:hypothetical protein